MQVLVIGNGNHSKKRVLPALEKIKFVENIVIADKNIKNKKKINSSLEIRNFDKELQNNDKYDLIIIATPPYNHKSSLLDAVNKSNNILVEKPISNDMNFVFGDMLKDLKKEKNIFESLMYLHHPVLQHVKELIKKHNIKKISSEFTVPHLPDNKYIYKKDLGGGSLFDQGIYPLSLALELSNNSKKIDHIEINNSDKYEVDLGGNIQMNINKNIRYFGKWGLGQDYKNSLELKDNDGKEFQIDFIFSKPDNLNSKIQITSNETISEIEVGKFDQFQIMYEDILRSDFTKFEYSNYKNLIERYDLIHELLKMVH
tara:strand:- start:7113 stop:8054 length:942 start_codon:yes stop_codon:yes gene_type:complete